MIYIITNKTNGKQYVGKTSKSLEQRWYQHCKNADYGINTHLCKAIRKYGKENFRIEFLCEGLDEEETFAIRKINPAYNMTKGGEGGDTSSSPNYQEALKQRNMKGANNPNFGKRGNRSPNFGKVRSEEQKQKYREAYKGKRIPVFVNGVYYESVSRAAKLLQRSERYIRIHDELNKWNY